ncbi:MAG TPA: hypothetical protein VMD79_03415 [Solirubrobacteraceae bacterium]|nr:hypothetical protein [Solirubrobacteraceae bacterium]
MDEHRHDQPGRPPQLAVLTDQLAERDADDWLAAEPNGEVAQLESPPPARSRRARLRRRGLLSIGAAVLSLAIAALVVVLQPRGTSRALADPSQAASAAESAGSFAFETESTLELAGGPIVRSTTKGEVNVEHHGAFKVSVTSPSGVGFERIVFPHAMFVRPLGTRGAGEWFGTNLRPPAAIGVHSGSGGGLGDPLGLVAALARNHRSHYVGRASVNGQHTRHYTLTLTIGQLLGPSAHVASSVGGIRVNIDVWQNSSQQLVRAVRSFIIGGPHAGRLSVTTNFYDYGGQTRISAPPGVTPTGTQRLDPTADDPVGASLLGTVAAGLGHSATPEFGPSRRARIGGRQLAPGRGPQR